MQFAILYHSFYQIALFLVKMKKDFLLLLVACFSIMASAQKVYFIYLQTEDQSPFYVRMGDKIYSSAASGYLVLPNLTDSTYYMSLGYARSNEPETKFSVVVNQGDRGFLIKKFEDGPALFDFEEMSVVKANESAKDNTVYTTKTDNFSNLLSKAASDPSLVKVPVQKKEEPVKAQPQKNETGLAKEADVKKEEVKPLEKPTADATTVEASATATAAAPPETTAPAADVKTTLVSNSDSSAMQQNVQQETTVSQPVSKEETVAEAGFYKPTTIVRRAESSTTEGFGVVFYDKSESHTDTIRILIPAAKVKLVSETETKPSSDEMLTKEKVDSVVSVATPQPEKNASTEKTSPQAESVASICSNSASEKDFLRLRKKMAAKESDESMIDEAKKEFKNKCFTVEQIKYLGGLFLTSAGRYQFFDAAYTHVSDAKNFATLQSQLNDEYYIKRFKALIGE